MISIHRTSRKLLKNMFDYLTDSEFYVLLIHQRYNGFLTEDLKFPFNLKPSVNISVILKLYVKVVEGFPFPLK